MAPIIRVTNSTGHPYPGQSRARRVNAGNPASPVQGLEDNRAAPVKGRQLLCVVCLLQRSDQERVCLVRVFC